jgi:hypothetical protein
LWHFLYFVAYVLLVLHVCRSEGTCILFTLWWMSTAAAVPQTECRGRVVSHSRGLWLKSWPGKRLSWYEFCL